MRDQNSLPSEYPESWDSGTYQTGASKPNKGQSATITVLLITTIFLGGIASALGLMNIRLLRQLVQQQSPVLPVAVDATGPAVSNFIRGNSDIAPKIPEGGRLELNMGGTAAALSADALQESARSTVATVTVTTNQGQEHTGPALILSSDGYLLTNAHLTENAASITVTFPDGTVQQAGLAGSDAYSDLSVLYVQTQGLTAAAFADPVFHFPLEDSAYVLQSGDTLLPGALLGGDMTRADGGMQALGVGDDVLVLYLTSFDADAGAVFDGCGNVIGFLCRPLWQEEKGRMLPTSQLMDIATQLVEQGAVSGRPCLGLQAEELSNFCRQYWVLDSGLEVTSVTEGSAAQENGLLSGDILLTLNGTALTTRQQLFEALLNAESGSVTLEVFRAGQQFTVTLPVTQTP